MVREMNYTTNAPARSNFARAAIYVAKIIGSLMLVPVFALVIIVPVMAFGISDDLFGTFWRQLNLVFGYWLCWVPLALKR